MPVLTEDQQIDYLFEAYAAIIKLSGRDNQSAIRGIAAVRLLLVDLVGEDRQREIIGQWNEAVKVNAERPNKAGDNSGVNPAVNKTQNKDDPFNPPKPKVMPPPKGNIL